MKISPGARIWLTVLVAGIITSALILSKASTPSSPARTGVISSELGEAKIVMPAYSYSWGEISINGGNVFKEFQVSNLGDAALEIHTIETSCHCTTASLIVNGREGPKFTMLNDPNRDALWRGEIPPGGKGIVKVEFDPLFHGPTATGPITRIVEFITNDPENRVVKLKLSGNVVGGT